MEVLTWGPTHRNTLDVADTAVCPSLGVPFRCLGCYARGLGTSQANSLKAPKMKVWVGSALSPWPCGSKWRRGSWKQCHLCSLPGTAPPGFSLWRLFSTLLSLRCSSESLGGMLGILVLLLDSILRLNCRTNSIWPLMDTACLMWHCSPEIPFLYRSR